MYDCRKLADSVSVMIYFKLRDWLVCHAAHLLTLLMFIPQVRALMAFILYMHLNQMAAILIFDCLAIPLFLFSQQILIVNSFSYHMMQEFNKKTSDISGAN